MINLSIQIDKIALAPPLGKVARRWEPEEDGSLTWRRRSNAVWKIEHHNTTPKSHKPIASREGVAFFAHKQSVTLDDFVFLRDIYQYCHIETGLTFTARQINNNVFKDKAAWPVRAGAEKMDPAQWIRKHNRVEHSAHFKMIRGAFHVKAA
jgi:hypothetical protein